MADSTLSKIKHFLSGKTATVIILLLAIAGRIIQLIFLFNIRADRSHQMLATHSFVTGHGISKAFTLPSNLSETIYVPLVNWPPGYSLLLSPFYILFNHNYIVAGLILDILSAIALIYISRKILKALNIPVYQVNLFTLLSGFTLYSFFIKTSSDSIAIAFYLGALYITLQLLKTKSLTWLQKSISLSIFLIASASMKFLYMPLIVIVPVFLILQGLANSNLILRKAGIVSLFIIGAGLASLIFYQKSISGAPAYIAQTEKGIFTENLRSAYPVFPAFFLSPETTGMLLRQPYESRDFIYSSFQYMYVLFLLTIIPFGFWTIYKLGFRNKSEATNFFYILFFLFLATIILLSVLSLKYAKEFGIWTYIQEARYYGLITILLQASVLVAYQHYKVKKNKLIRYIFYFFLALFLPEMFRGMLFAVNRIANSKKEIYTWQHDYKLQQFADEIIKRKQHDSPVGQVILAGSSPYMNNRICLYSHIPLLNEVGRINNLTSLNTKKSVLLLVALREDARKDFLPFLSLPEKEEAGQFEGYYFYTVYVKPH